MTFGVFLSMIYLQHIYIYFNILPFPFLLSMCHQRPFLHYYFIDLTEYYLLTFTSISSLDLMICQGSSYFDLHLPFLLRSYFPNSGIFFQKFNFWVFSQSIKRAIYNRTNYIHLHTLQVEDEKFVQICGKSLLWHADSFKSSDYLPFSYQSLFQFHLDHILLSFQILTINCST